MSVFPIAILFHFHSTNPSNSAHNEVGSTKSTEMSPAIGRFAIAFLIIQNAHNSIGEQFFFYCCCCFKIAFERTSLNGMRVARSNKNDQIDANVF